MSFTNYIKNHNICFVCKKQMEFHIYIEVIEDDGVIPISVANAEYILDNNKYIRVSDEQYRANIIIPRYLNIQNNKIANFIVSHYQCLLFSVRFVCMEENCTLYENYSSIEKTKYNKINLSKRLEYIYFDNNKSIQLNTSEKTAQYIVYHPSEYKVIQLPYDAVKKSLKNDFSYFKERIGRMLLLV